MAVLAKGSFFAAAAFAALMAAGAAHAAGKCGNDASGFNAWVGAYTADAKARGIDTRPMQGVKYDTGVIKIDRAQHKAFRGSLEDFMQRRAPASYVKKAKGYMKSEASLLRRIEQRYGVQPEVLLAIWGMETGFGSYMGKQNTVSAIVTLAYDCRRPDFFRPHALAALKLVDSGALTVSSVGAMHGEIGHTQFLPGNVVKYGVGSKDLRERETALISTANFLRGHGWKPGASYDANMGAIAGWNAARVYQQAIAIMAREIDK
jgi:membrane-bound lytic murein transglycosylase B